MKKGEGRFSFKQVFYSTDGRMNKKAIEGIVFLIVFLVALFGIGISLVGTRQGSPTGLLSLPLTCGDGSIDDPEFCDTGIGEGGGCSEGFCLDDCSGCCGDGETDGSEECEMPGDFVCPGEEACLDDCTCPTTTTTTTTGTTSTSFTTTSTVSTTTSTFVLCSTTTTTTTTTTSTSTTSTATTSTSTSTTETTGTSTTTTDTGTTSTTTTITTSTTTTSIVGIGSIGPQQVGACCGDGIFNQPEEECDDGNNIDGDGCSSTCEREFCGDETLQPALGEECDGDDVDCDDGFTCNEACKCEGCGDGAVSGNEECDPGDPGLACADGSTCPDDCDCPDCGNNEVNTGEECDGEDDDACPGECNAACLCPDCPNGVLDSGEECDPFGPSVFCPDDYECAAEDACTCEFCGDGQVNDNEECDDGNNDDGDGCEGDCTEPFCGNGIFDPPSEQCDFLDLGICAQSFSCNPDCTCDCDSDVDCNDDNLCTSDACVDNVCEFTSSVSCPAKACATASCNPSTGLCEYVTNPNCRSGSGGGSGSQATAPSCCEYVEYGNVAFDCDCTIEDHGNIRVQPLDCCTNPESAKCKDFCRVVVAPAPAAPAGGYFTRLPIYSTPSAPEAVVQEPAPRGAEAASAGRPVDTFAGASRGPPIVSSPTGAFDRFVNANGALIAGGLLIAVLVALAIFVVVRRPPKSPPDVLSDFSSHHGKHHKK